MSRPKPTQVKVLRLLRRLHLDENRLFAVLAISTGALAGMMVVLYHLLLQSIYTWLYGNLNFQRAWDWRLPLYATGGGLVAALVLRLMPESRGSGVAQTKIAILARNGYIALRSTLGKFLASAIGIGSGQSMGPEGPALHIGAGVASLIGRLTASSKTKMQQLVPVGAAAGLAAIFNAPITAVLFVLEEVIGDVNTPLLGSTIIAAVTAVMVRRAVLGGKPLFHVPAYTLGGLSDLLIFVVLGVLGGIISAGFGRAILWGRAHMLRSPQKIRTWIPVTGSLFCGLVALRYPQILSVGYTWVDQALNDRMVLHVLVWLAILKFLSTAICYATGNSGGVFAPSLYLGAMFGGALGSVAHILFPASRLSDAGAYALVGMGALFAGINRTPMTSIFMIFEVTQDYNLILPLMVANIIAYGVAARMSREGLYEGLARQDGVILPSRHNEYVLRRLRNSDALQAHPLVLEAGESAEQALQRASDASASAFAVLQEGQYLGMVRAETLARAVAEGKGDEPVSEWADTDAGLLLYPDEPVDRSLALLASGQPLLPVVSRLNSRQLVGVVSTADIMHAFALAAQNEKGEGVSVA